MGEVLYNFVLERRPKKIVEFGVYRGHSTVSMGMALKALGRSSFEGYVVGTTATRSQLRFETAASPAQARFEAASHRTTAGSEGRSLAAKSFLDINPDG